LIDKKEVNFLNKMTIIQMSDIRMDVKNPYWFLISFIQEVFMWFPGVVKEIINILMGSRCYFELSLMERHNLIKYLLRSHSVLDLK
jgi:hypothetical protein